MGEVGKAQSGVGFPDREQGGKAGVPFYKVSDMNNAGNEHEMCTANNYVSEAQCKKNGWTPITEISVVFAKVGAAIMLNRKRLVRISFLLDNNTMAYKFGTEWDIDFGKTLFERIDLTDLVQIGALPSYNATDVECVEISLPDKPEQHRIGVLFKQLDNLITLHQRKDFSMRCGYDIFLKMVNTQKMANAWEQRKLGEVANIQKGQQLGKAEMSNNGAFYVLNGGMEPSGYTNQYNTFANTISISEGGNSCGYVSLNLEQFWSGGHNYTLQNPRIDTFFLYQWLKRHEKGIMALRVGSGLPNIQKSALQDVIVAYPKKSEQRAIAEILNKIDNLITLHQREHRQKKNPFLNENRSLFREAIANAWEQRKLGDTIDFYSGLTYSPSDVVKDNGVFVLRSSNVREGEIVDEDNVYVRAGAVNSDNVNIGDIIVVVRNGSRSLIGKHAKIKKNMPQTVIGAFMTGLRYENSSYLNAVLNTSIFEKEIEKDLGATINQITTGAFKKMVFPFPKQHEQLQIGDFFEQIDNLITLHQRGLIKIQGDKNGKKRSFRRIVQRLF